ncbi:MAG: hypothetical protein MJE63_31075 [Proteobacteria bacterium]|nr:hypothetical protein [Pseudomonadota bacterium]
MKKLILQSTIAIALVGMLIGLLSCKDMNTNEDSSKISVDISGLLAQLPANNSSSSASSQSVSQSSQVSGQVASPPENDAQSAVSTLIVVPLTYSKNGEPYSNSDFDESKESNLEDDAINSAGFLQFIQLPTSSSTVEIEVPTTSEGWQLLAAATKDKLESADEFEDAVIYYIGFTEQAFTSADDFNDANVTLELKRHCDQDATNRPKGCATFDGSRSAIVTDAVEIHRVEIDGSADTSVSYPLVVRSSPGAGDVSADSAKLSLDGILGIGGASSITVYATHQLSDGKSTTCKDTTNDQAFNIFSDNCGMQTYTRDY